MLRLILNTPYRLACAVFFVLAACTLTPGRISGGDPGPASPKKYYSTNGQYCFTVIPVGSMSGSNDRERPIDTLIPSPENDAGCRGVLYARDDEGQFRTAWSVKLLNRVSPADAVVSDNGEHVVTFDNWGSLGYGDHVVSIYGGFGQPIASYPLSSITRGLSLSRLPRSASSIHWGGKHYIDEKNGMLILKVVANGRFPHEEGARFIEIRVDLATGKFIWEGSAVPAAR